MSKQVHRSKLINTSGIIVLALVASIVAVRRGCASYSGSHEQFRPDHAGRAASGPSDPQSSNRASHKWTGHLEPTTRGAASQSADNTTRGGESESAGNAATNSDSSISRSILSVWVQNEDGGSVEGVSVFAKYRNGPTRQETTDHAGQCSVDGIRGEAISIWASRGPETSTRRVLLLTHSRIETRLVLRRLASIRVSSDVATDHATFGIIRRPSALVKVAEVGGPGLTSQLFLGIPQGSYLAVVLDQEHRLVGSADVVAQSGSCSEVYVPRRSNAAREVHDQLEVTGVARMGEMGERLGQVRGVLVSGQGVVQPGVWMELLSMRPNVTFPRVQETDSGGAFCFDRLETGDYWLFSSDPTAGRAGVVASVRRGECADVGRVEVRYTGALAGRVVGTDRTHEGVIVRAFPSGFSGMDMGRLFTRWPTSAMSNDDSFLVENVPPGHYVLAAYESNSAIPMGTSSGTEVLSGEVTITDINVQDLARVDVSVDLIHRHGDWKAVTVGAIRERDGLWIELDPQGTTFVGRVTPEPWTVRVRSLFGQELIESNRFVHGARTMEFRRDFSAPDSSTIVVEAPEGDGVIEVSCDWRGSLFVHVVTQAFGVIVEKSIYDVPIDGLPYGEFEVFASWSPDGNLPVTERLRVVLSSDAPMASVDLRVR